jgi:GH15 family glucan-1,4-alpha-glucosidase
MKHLAAAATRNPEIGDYALIGDCRSAALVSREGSLDWLCWPRFDSPSIFAALLDSDRGGRFAVQPVGPYRSERRYVPETNVLETVFQADTGSVALRDLMPVAGEEEKRAILTPEHEVLREIEGLGGEVRLRIHYAPHPDYARQTVALRRRGALGIWCKAGGGHLILQSDVDLAVSPDRASATADVTIRAGERRYLSLTYGRDAPAVIPELGAAAHDRLMTSVRWWRQWINQCIYDGPYRETVVRSALALKLMTFAPSGAVVAAPTTSLPEKPGGQRNWDYRYCWLRDASFTVRAFLDLGYEEEASAYAGWLLHATRLAWPDLQVLYNVHGEARLPERELPHLAGYDGARPVRIGNDARGQLQLDVYGEVLDAVARFFRPGVRMDRDTVRFLDGLGHTVCDRWREPDEGIWEGRSGRHHHTHSKVLCWVALDRLVTLHEASGARFDVERFRRERDAIRQAVEERGYNPALRSYTQLFDGDTVDASLLTLPLYGYIDAADPRMESTCARIHERLGVGDLLYRYAEGTDDGLPPGEGAFGICGFWAVECQARRGETHDATQAFERLLGHANEVGLFAEETDPETGAALGNFPQAFTHVGLINAALTLAGHQMARGAARHATSTAKGGIS